MNIIGIIGLGIMGSAYAANVLRAGMSVAGWDVDDDRMEALRRLGGEPAGSIAEIAGRADLVLTALPTTEALADAVAGRTGLVAGAHPGLIVAEMSTFPLAAKERARDALARGGVAMLDAPVSGTGLQAASGDVAIYASGDQDALAAAQPVFDVLGKATFNLGEFGNGSRMKYLANLLVSIHNLATAEAFVLGMKAGLDPERILEVISAGVGSSRIFEIRGPMMVANDYEPAAARSRLFVKDVTVISDFARDLGAPTPLLDASRPYYDYLVEAGFGDLDPAALCALLESQAGIER